MSIPIQNSRAGTCPHGCPQGACPICNGMSSGMQTKKIETTKPREMSWSECYAQWQKMLAKQADKAQQKDTFFNKNNSLESKNTLISNIAGKIVQIGNIIYNKMPSPVKNVMAGLNKFVMKPFTNTIKSVFQKVSNLTNTLKERFINIMDKLAAIFGEEKLFKEKQIQERIKNLPKKLFKLFGLYDVDDEQEEEKVIEEEKRALELKEVKETLLHTDGEKGFEDDEN